MTKDTISIAISGALSAVAAFFADKFGVLIPVLLFLLFLFALDYITALIRSAILAAKHPEDPKAGFNSKIGKVGILKKVGYLASIVVAMSLDVALLFCAQYLGLTIPCKTFFGLLIAIFWCLNEFISILENIDEMDIGMPDWIMQIVKLLKVHIEKKGSDAVNSINNELGEADENGNRVL